MIAFLWHWFTFLFRHVLLRLCIVLSRFFSTRDGFLLICEPDWAWSINRWRSDLSGWNKKELSSSAAHPIAQPQLWIQFAGLSITPWSLRAFLQLPSLSYHVITYSYLHKYYATWATAWRFPAKTDQVLIPTQGGKCCHGFSLFTHYFAPRWWMGFWWIWIGWTHHRYILDFDDDFESRNNLIINRLGPTFWWCAISHTHTHSCALINSRYAGTQPAITAARRGGAAVVSRFL